ncbi:MAG: hypothetical protein NZZ41_04870 [Candidatus Dojkabacteria bacterium]|nr:hypothetical protein [Candidatus Dojkabacteria bacterium]
MSIEFKCPICNYRLFEVSEGENCHKKIICLKCLEKGKTVHMIKEYTSSKIENLGGGLFKKINIYGEK